MVFAPQHDQILHRLYFYRMTFKDLRDLYLNRPVLVGYKNSIPIIKSAGDVWLCHPNRIQYTGGVVFDPSGHPIADDAFNLWKGFAVQPKLRSWRRMQDHIFKIICSNNKKYYDYLIRWIARMVQNPAEQGEVAVVMRGDEGTGKGTVARALMRIMGQHGLSISNPRHLVGNFNAHLRDCVFLFPDECFFAGDKQHIGVLKRLVTERSLTIEAKYQNAVQTPNFLHIMMASNEDWVIPASIGSRRFFVLDVSAVRKNDHAYFAAIWEEMEAGGYEGMLHDLLRVDLTDFNVRNVPITEALLSQRKLSLDTQHAWWVDVLSRGYVFRSRLGLEAIFGTWHDKISTELLFESYIDFARSRRERHPVSRELLGQFVRDMGGMHRRLSNAAVGEHLIDEVNQFGGTSRKATPVVELRPWGYALGTLELSRKAFFDATGLPFDWEPVEELEDAAAA